MTWTTAVATQSLCAYLNIFFGGARHWWEECIAIIKRKTGARSIQVLHNNGGEHKKTRKGWGSKQQCWEKANYVYNATLLGIHGYCIALHLVLTGAES